MNEASRPAGPTRAGDADGQAPFRAAYPTLRTYAALATLRAAALVAAALTGLFSLLEFVEQLASVGQGSYRVADALGFVALTAPARLLQVAPVSLLLGTLLALGGMARHAELAAMLSLGMPRRRIIGAAAATVLPISVVLFALMQAVIPRAETLATEWRAASLAGAGDAGGFWTEHDRQFLHVARFERGGRPVGIDLYAFRADGSLASVIEARRAAVEPDGTWRLADVSRRTVDAWRITDAHLATLEWRSFISARQLRFLLTPLASEAPTALLRHIRGLPPDQRASREELVLWGDASLPLVLFAMVLAATPFVFAPPRSWNGSHHLARGVAVGIVFSLGQEIASRVGLLLDLDPGPVVLFPPLLVIAVAATLLRRENGRGRRAPVSRPLPAT